MQVSLHFIGNLGIAILFLVLAELMIRGLIKGLESPLEPYSDRNRRFSFRFFNLSGSLWGFSHFLLWIFSAFFLYIGFSELVDLGVFVFFLFFIVGTVRRERAMKDIQGMYSRVKISKNLLDLDLYRNLIENENSAFMEVINDSEKLKQLERTARHTRNSVMFDPKKMQRLESREEIELRLGNHLKFLMSEESSVTHTIEEIYVILFMLSEKANFPEGLVKDILSNQDRLQSLIE